MKKATIACIILVGMFFILSAGCVEIHSQTRSTETILGMVEVTEHTHLWGDDGPFTKTYDVTMTVLGQDVISVKGISEAEKDALLNKNQS